MEQGRPPSVWHLLGPQEKPPSPSGWHTSEELQPEAQPVSTHWPSTHSCPVGQDTPAQVPTQRGSSKEALGLHTSSGWQVLGSQGSSTQTPPLHSSPGLQPKK